MTDEDRAHVRNVADRDQVRKASKKATREREEELRDVRQLLGMPWGRRFLWRYLSLCGVFQSSWEPSARIHFNEGRRDVGLRLWADITEADPEALIRMMLEAKKTS